MKIGINGMGRIGRLALRDALGGVERDQADRNTGTRLDVVHLNEIKGGAATTAHLLEFDTIHRRWRADISHDETGITIDGRRMGFTDAATPGEVDWAAAGVEMVLECSGKFLTPDSSRGISIGGSSALSWRPRSRIHPRSTSWSGSMIISMIPGSTGW